MNNHAHVVNPKSGVCLIEFLQVHLKLADLRKYISGTTRQKLTQARMKDIVCVLPPLALQQQFVEIARRTDEAKAALRKSIADVDAIIKGCLNNG